MKLISFNAGLLLYDLLNLNLFIPVKYIEERLKAIPEELLKLDADIVALQEVYHIRHKTFLKRQLQDTYPYIYFNHQGFRFAIENGLILLSKVPLQKNELIVFKNIRLEEYLFARTGFTKSQIHSQGIDIMLYHIHLTAGGLLGPEHPKAEKLRHNQIEQLMQDISLCECENIILIGDLNCGPDVSKKNFDLFNKFGFEILTRGQQTWDPNNPLNKHGIHKHCPPQSIDHILVNTNFKNKLKINSNTLVFTEPKVEVRDKKITPSDHYGLMLHLEFLK